MLDLLQKNFHHKSWRQSYPRQNSGNSSFKKNFFLSIHVEDDFLILFYVQKFNISYSRFVYWVTSITTPFSVSWWLICSTKRFLYFSGFGIFWSQSSVLYLCFIGHFCLSCLVRSVLFLSFVPPQVSAFPLFHASSGQCFSSLSCLVRSVLFLSFVPDQFVLFLSFLPGHISAFPIFPAWSHQCFSYLSCLIS